MKFNYRVSEGCYDILHPTEKSTSVFMYFENGDTKKRISVSIKNESPDSWEHDFEKNPVETAFEWIEKWRGKILFSTYTAEVKEFEALLIEHKDAIEISKQEDLWIELLEERAKLEKEIDFTHDVLIAMYEDFSPERST